MQQESIKRSKQGSCNVFAGSLTLGSSRIRHLSGSWTRLSSDLSPNLSKIPTICIYKISPGLKCRHSKDRRNIRICKVIQKMFTYIELHSSWNIDGIYNDCQFCSNSYWPTNIESFFGGLTYVMSWPWTKVRPFSCCWPLVLCSYWSVGIWP